MRYAFFLGLVAILGLASCGGEEGKQFNCACAFTCDGEALTETFSSCEDPSGAEKALEVAVTECTEELGEAGCMDAACDCSCTETETECAIE